MWYFQVLNSFIPPTWIPGACIFTAVSFLAKLVSCIMGILKQQGQI